MEKIMIYLISRHAGAIEWLTETINQPCTLIDHLTEEMEFKNNDWVIGTLPLTKIATICTQGAKFFLLEVEVPKELRGIDLSKEQLIELGAQLTEYRCERVSS
jgi:CRISPR-associated protein Csx16